MSDERQCRLAAISILVECFGPAVGERDIKKATEILVKRGAFTQSESAAPEPRNDQHGDLWTSEVIAACKRAGWYLPVRSRGLPGFIPSEAMRAFRDGYAEGKSLRSKSAQTVPAAVEHALKQMRFGCPFKKEGVAEYDVPEFERRMQRAADVIERALASASEVTDRYAERYRWLRMHFRFANDSEREIWFDRNNYHSALEGQSADQLDRAIDAAMAPTDRVFGGRIG